MNLKFIPFVIFFSFAVAAEGGNDSHGGDTVWCEKSEENSFQGYFNLDYLLTYTAQNDNADVVPVTSWDESSARILTILNGKVPKMARSFQVFVKALFNTNDYHLPHIWKEGSFGLPLYESSDEVYQYIDRHLPKNCYKVESEGKIHLIRTITRTTKLGVAHYLYDSGIIDKLTAIQQSFLFVHEWLRSYTNDERVIRKVNRLLHSNRIELATFDLSVAFSKIGLVPDAIPHVAYVPICRRTVAVSKCLESVFNQSCSEITSTKTTKFIVPFRLGNHEIERLQPGDFNGFSRISEIDLSDNLIQELQPGIFNQLVLLKMLSLKGNRIARIPSRAFYGLIAPGIDLEANQLTSIESNAFSSLKPNRDSWSFWINLKNNKLATIEPGAFKNIPLAVDLSHNQFQRFPMEAFSALETVEHIDLSYNPVEFSQEMGEVILPKRLGRLLLNRTAIQSISPSLIKFLEQTEVGTLELMENGIKEIPSGAFANTRISRMILRGNEISKINLKDFKSNHSESFLEFDLSDNPIVSIHASVDVGYPGNQFHIKQLKLDRTQIRAITPEVTAFLIGVNAQQIHLRENKIKEIPSRAFNGMKFQVLDLSHNEISSIDPSAFSEIILGSQRHSTVLDLSHNQLKSIPLQLEELARRSRLNLRLAGNPFSPQEKYRLKTEVDKHIFDENGAY